MAGIQYQGWDCHGLRLDSGLRRNDDGALRCGSGVTSGLVAQAGAKCTLRLDSGLRRNDERGFVARLRQWRVALLRKPERSAHCDWIPAFAGMTIGFCGARRESSCPPSRVPLTVIPDAPHSRRHSGRIAHSHRHSGRGKAAIRNLLFGKDAARFRVPFAVKPPTAPE